MGLTQNVIWIIKIDREEMKHLLT